MNDVPPLNVLKRLRAIEWDNLDGAINSRYSRNLLMWEYLRRTALWVKLHDLDCPWPLFDIAEYIAPDFHLGRQIDSELEQFLIRSSNLGVFVARAVRGAVRWAGLIDSSNEIASVEIPCPYEPLIVMFERGGGFWLEEFIDLQGSMIPVSSIESSMRFDPFLVTSKVTLDAYDMLSAPGYKTFYEIPDIADTSGTSQVKLIRRYFLANQDSLPVDESLDSELNWTKTSQLYRLEGSGHDIRYLEVDQHRAASIIEQKICWNQGRNTPL